MYNYAFAGPGEYDDVVIEIDCSPAFVAVIRNERGRYFIEIFNKSDKQPAEFALGQKHQHNTVDLEEFMRAVELAKKELNYQTKS